MSSTEKRKYKLEQSPLYKLSNKRKLAELLKTDIHVINGILKSDENSNYNIFKEKKSRRFITEPKGDLANIHKSLLRLFTRIAPTDYIHSATKKRSYNTNAKAHINSTKFFKVDIKKFFPNVKFHHIHRFFSQTLKCSSDISTILALLCSVETKLHGVHLPTGSCISPILSFLVNRNLFDEIDSICKTAQCTFTLYVDDITISGENATKETLNLICKQIFVHGYGYHKIKVFNNVPAKVTGLVITGGSLALPFARSRKIRELNDSFNISTGKLRPKLLSSLIGSLSEAEQINPAYKIQRLNLMSRHKKEWGSIVAARIKAQKNRNSKPGKSSNP